MFRLNAHATLQHTLAPTSVLISLAAMPSEALARYLDPSPEAQQRRTDRNRKRSFRQMAQDCQDTRTNRRTKRLACCGQERRYCICAKSIEHMIDTHSVDALIKDIRKREMLTARDPKDMAFILKELSGANFSISSFMFRCALFRLYSRPGTYTALAKHVRQRQPGSKGPDWRSMQKTLARMYAGLEPVWGGMFYPATLKAVKLANGKTKMFKNVKTPAQQAERDIHLVKVVWSALQQDTTLSTYYKARRFLSQDSASQPVAERVMKARDAFSNWYDHYYEHMKKTRRAASRTMQ